MAQEKTRRTLINSMNSLLCKRDFSGISIEDLCEEALVSRRTFYRYYPDKYSLLAEVYLECYFSKLDISEMDSFWQIFYKVCDQIYDNQPFFSHAFAVKGQNGFWEEAAHILAPYMRRDFPVSEDITEIVDFYIYNDINILFQLIEHWIQKGFRRSPKEVAAEAHDSFKVHGKWIYEAATGRPRTEYAKSKLNSGEW